MTAAIAGAPAAPFAVVFTVGPVRCGLRQAAVRELLPVPHIWRPPGLPRALEGFMNLSGAAVPVVSLERLFNLTSEAEGSLDGGIYRHLVLLHGEDAGQPVALLVNRVIEVIALAPERLRSVEEQSTLNGCVEAEVETEGGFVHLLAADRILLERERRILSELRQSAEERLREWGTSAP